MMSFVFYGELLYHCSNWLSTSSSGISPSNGGSDDEEVSLKELLMMMFSSSLVEYAIAVESGERGIAELENPHVVLYL